MQYKINIHIFRFNFCKRAWGYFLFFYPEITNLAAINPQNRTKSDKRRKLEILDIHRNTADFYVGMNKSLTFYVNEIQYRIGPDIN